MVDTLGFPTMSIELSEAAFERRSTHHTHTHTGQDDIYRADHNSHYQCDEVMPLLWRGALAPEVVEAGPTDDRARPLKVRIGETTRRSPVGVAWLWLGGEPARGKVSVLPSHNKLLLASAGSGQRKTDSIKYCKPVRDPCPAQVRDSRALTRHTPLLLILEHVVADV